MRIKFENSNIALQGDGDIMGNVKSSIHTQPLYGYQ